MGNTKIKVYAIKETELESLVIRATEAGADTAIKKWNEIRGRQAEERKNTLVKDVKKVLSTYRALKSDLVHSEYEDEEAQAELRFRALEDLMGSEKTDIEHLVMREKKRLKENAWTKRQIDRALALMKEDCERSSAPETMRRYNIIMKMYINDTVTSMAEIAEQENVTERSAYRDISEGCKMLLPYLFDVDKILGVCENLTDTK